MITYTDAPEAYDGFGTVTLAVAGRTEKRPVRKVDTPEQHVEWQRMRYGSGMNLYATEERWAEIKDAVLVDPEA